MKNILTLLVLTAFALCAKAQSSTPRFGTTPNQDNTGRSLTYKYITKTDATGADTLRITTNAYVTIVKATVVDSLAFAPILTKAYAGDKLEFLITNSAGSGHLAKFVGANWQVGTGGASLALTASKRATISFEFDGTYWVERCRTVQ